MEWTDQQNAAIKAVQSWLKNDTKKQKVFRLFGFAGTGKTTLAKHMAELAKGGVAYASLSGKAASVLHKKGCTGAQTIHSLIYYRSEVKHPVAPIYTEKQIAKGKEQKYRKEIIWTSRINDPACPLREAKLLVLDEVSMVGDDLAHDLLEFGVPILAIGDPAQLPPVDGAGYFTHPKQKPDFMLDQIHRQAEGNPIIEMATKIRQGDSLSIGTYGGSSVQRSNGDTNDVLFAADQIMCGTNKRRQVINRKMRSMHGNTDDYPVEGDKVICLANDRTKMLMNGTIWNIEEFRFDHISEVDKRAGLIPVTLVSEDDKTVKAMVTVSEEMFHFKSKDEIDDLRSRDAKELNLFDYGYAITVHKAQGSQWDNVAVVEDHHWGDDHKRWLYTAITRAAENVTLIKK